MSVYKIEIASAIYGQIRDELKTTHYVTEREAINALTKALELKNIKFRRENRVNRISFLNECDGEMAAVVPD